MTIEHSSVISHPRAEVFAWHTRPGAMPRLVPPWQPMNVLVETDSLAAGRAVLELPAGVRWVAQHNPAEYQPPRRFVDELAFDGPLSWPARVTGWWRHTHEFAYAGPGKTRVLDRVDLAAHRLAAEHGMRPLVVAVTGSSGLVGSALTAFLTSSDHPIGAPACPSP